jgi:hypothetical protein
MKHSKKMSPNQINGILDCEICSFLACAWVCEIQCYVVCLCGDLISLMLKTIMCSNIGQLTFYIRIVSQLF